MKILIVKMSSLGDVIHTLPMVYILKKHLKNDVEIDWVVNSEYLSLLENNGLIRKVIPFNRKTWLTPIGFFKTFSHIKSFARSLKDEHYDVVIDVQGLLKSAMVVAMAGGKKSIGFSDAREGASLFYDTKIIVNNVMHAVEKNLLFLDYFNLKWDKEDIIFKVAYNHEDVMVTRKILDSYSVRAPYVVFCPFSRWNTKMWPEENFHHLESLLKAVGFDVVWTGSKNEKLKRAVEKDLTGQLTLNQLYILMKDARFVVTCDSGAMHLATAAGTDIVAIFGPTSPTKTGPYVVKNKAIVINRSDLDCVPCFSKKCKIGTKCLDITAELVFEKIKEGLIL